MLAADREKVASVLMSLGYSVNRAWQFAMRDERTPSAHIAPNGFMFDFGSGWHGDLADFLVEVKGYEIAFALQEARRLLDLPIPDNLDFSKFEKEAEKKKKGFLSDDFIEQFKKNRRENFPRFAKLLRETIPSVTDYDRLKGLALRYEVGYSPEWEGRPDRLVMPVRDEKRRIVTLWRYNPELGGENKLIYVKDRPRYPFALSDLMRYALDPRKRVVWVCEGEKDALNAIGNGYAAVTPGGSVCLFRDDQLPYFKDFRVVLAGDFDDAGRNFNERMKAQLEPFAAHIEVIDWKALTGKSDLKKGYDLTDYLVDRKRA